MTDATTTTDAPAGAGHEAERAGDDGALAAQAAGRARVRAVLIEPLRELRTSSGQTAEWERLADKLAYMTEAALIGLRELVIRTAYNNRPPVPGAKPPRCPAPALITGWAFALQEPPATGSDYVASILRSVMGCEARNGGWHVELMRHARRVGPPPQSYLRSRLMAEADDNRARLVRIRERMQAGTGGRDDIAWLAAWHDDLRVADALVDQGEARRAALVLPPAPAVATGDAA